MGRIVVVSPLDCQWEFPLCESISNLAEIEPHFDVQRGIDGYAVFHSRAKSPLFQGADCVVVETETEAAHQMQHIDSAVSAHDCFQHDGTLIARFARFFGILRFDSINDCWIRDTASHVIRTVAAASARTIDRAGTVPLSIASTFAVADTSSDSGSRR